MLLRRVRRRRRTWIGVMTAHHSAAWHLKRRRRQGTMTPSCRSAFREQRQRSRIDRGADLPGTVGPASLWTWLIWLIHLLKWKRRRHGRAIVTASVVGRPRRWRRSGGGRRRRDWEAIVCPSIPGHAWRDLAHVQRGRRQGRRQRMTS